MAVSIITTPSRILKNMQYLKNVKTADCPELIQLHQMQKSIKKGYKILIPVVSVWTAASITAIIFGALTEIPGGSALMIMAVVLLLIPPTVLWGIVGQMDNAFQVLITVTAVKTAIENVLDDVDYRFCEKLDENTIINGSFYPVQDFNSYRGSSHLTAVYNGKIYCLAENGDTFVPSIADDALFTTRLEALSKKVRSKIEAVDSLYQ